MIWASQDVPLETWQKIFTKLRSEGRDAIYIGCGYNIDNLNVFDGIHEYGIFGFLLLHGMSGGNIHILNQVNYMVVYICG